MPPPQTQTATQTRQNIPHSPSAGAAIHGIFFFYWGFNNFRHSANAHPATDDGLTLGICKPPPVNRQLSVTRKLPFVDVQPLSFLHQVSTIFNVLRWGVPDGVPFSFFFYTRLYRRQRHFGPNDQTTGRWG